MLFNSLEFLVFLPVVLGAYLLAPRALQNLLLLAASYAFYGFWDPRFLGLILLSTTVDYGVGLALARTEGQGPRRLLLCTSVAVNLGILGLFKYFDFFARSLGQLAEGLGWHLSVATLDVVLPVGISFYTFQSLSYTIDVHRRRIEAERNPVDFAAFVAFFPQLVAGPIERAGDLLPQLKARRSLDLGRMEDGARLALWGFFKKVVVADNLDRLVTGGYGPEAGGLYALVATYAFAFQIYCDFSGYSDIARGVARFFGIELSRNFALPYLATSIREFWQRWHVSLSSWFREYLYIPLGGNRGSLARGLFNVMVTFVVSGLWHGADLRFVVWGALHGLYYVPSVLLRRRRGTGAAPRPPTRIGTLGGWLVTFHLVLLAWVFFRADSVAAAWELLTRIASMGAGDDGLLPPPVLVVEMIVLCAGLLGIECARRRAEHPLALEFLHPLARTATTVTVFLGILVLGNFDAVPFLYFQF